MSITAASLLAFLIASFVLAVTPGPGVLYIVTRSVAQGRRAGLASTFGVALGNFGNALGAALGLSAIFAVSSTAFTVVKLAGAAYLIYLGIQTMRRSERADTPNVAAAPVGRVMRQGFIVALLNPKTALFFTSFLPQFVEPTNNALIATVTLGGLFVLIAAITDAGYALAAGSAAGFLRRNQSLQSAGRYVSGSVYIGLGLWAAVTPQRAQ
ncbi:MAG: LysE family translocator [Planctomycetota bacterium]